MLIYEYRVILPMTVEEYRVGQLFTVAEASKHETGGGDGVEILVNEKFNMNQNKPEIPLLDGDYTTGQYTQKIYYLAQKAPTFVRLIAPASALMLNEHAWNAFPYCRTVISAHKLPPHILQQVKVVYIDIANINPNHKDYVAKEDPNLFHSTITNRGPLSPEWWKSADYKGPIMCAYKLVTTEFKSLLIQGRVEKIIQNQEKRLFENFHRQVFCFMDKWHGLTIEDIRRIEEETKEELNVQRKQGALRGHTSDEG